MMAFVRECQGTRKTHLTQYFNIFGNRGIYHEGWLAATLHNIPWIFNAKLPALDDDVWELLRTCAATSRRAVDLAASNPKKFEEMKEIFRREAIKYKVFSRLMTARQNESLRGRGRPPGHPKGPQGETFTKGCAAS